MVVVVSQRCVDFTVQCAVFHDPTIRFFGLPAAYQRHNSTDENAEFIAAFINLQTHLMGFYILLCCQSMLPQAAIEQADGVVNMGQYAGVS